MLPVSTTDRRTRSLVGSSMDRAYRRSVTMNRGVQMFTCPYVKCCAGSRHDICAARSHPHRPDHPGDLHALEDQRLDRDAPPVHEGSQEDRKSSRLKSSHVAISYVVHFMYK